MTPLAWLMVGVLWWMWFWLFQPLFIDQLRCRLFEIRGRLFLLAADGKIAFDSPAYRHTLEMLNALIRYSHRIGAMEIILIGLIPAPEPKSSRSGLAALSEESRQSLDGINLDIVKAVASFVLWSSPMAWAAMSAIGIWLLVRDAMRWALSFGSSAVTFANPSVLKKASRGFIARFPELNAIPRGRVAA